MHRSKKCLSFCRAKHSALSFQLVFYKFFCLFGSVHRLHSLKSAPFDRRLQLRLLQLQRSNAFQSIIPYDLWDCMSFLQILHLSSGLQLDGACIASNEMRTKTENEILCVSGFALFLGRATKNEYFNLIFICCAHIFLFPSLFSARFVAVAQNIAIYFYVVGCIHSFPNRIHIKWTRSCCVLAWMGTHPVSSVPPAPNTQFKQEMIVNWFCSRCGDSWRKRAQEKYVCWRLSFAICDSFAVAGGTSRTTTTTPTPTMSR